MPLALEQQSAPTPPPDQEPVIIDLPNSWESRKALRDGQAFMKNTRELEKGIENMDAMIAESGFEDNPVPFTEEETSKLFALDETAVTTRRSKVFGWVKSKLTSGRESQESTVRSERRIGKGTIGLAAGALLLSAAFTGKVVAPSEQITQPETTVVMPGMTIAGAVEAGTLVIPGTTMAEQVQENQNKPLTPEQKFKLGAEVIKNAHLGEDPHKVDGIIADTLRLAEARADSANQPGGVAEFDRRFGLMANQDTNQAESATQRS